MVSVTVEDIKLVGDEKETIKKVVKKVLNEEKIKHDVNVYVILTNNENIHQINLEYRGVDSPTDVLSFPIYESDEIELLKKEKTDDVEETLGDIIISIPKVKAQAKEYGHSYERELAYLTTHGMLHLLGYDHINPDEKEVMREREEKILSKLKITRE
ncbi:MAG: rRNA maturation RNase YbeY [Clostridia bacterium]|nr:rRNA maturation RNase YbeY [Clostridia bacterium]